MKDDTTFQAGDVLMLNFRAQFVQKEGTRHAVAALAVQYDGDSVSHSERHVYGSGDVSVTVEAVNRPIKRVYGFVYMISEWNINPRLLFIFSPSLVRIHRDMVLLEKEKAKADSLKMARDSVKSVPATGDSQKVTIPTALDPNLMHSRPVPRGMKLER